MKNIVYSLMALGVFLQADSTSYTRIAWTEVPKSVFKTAEFYNPNIVQKEIVQEEQVIDEMVGTTPVIEEDNTILQTATVIDESKEEVVKLDTPTWIFVE